MRTRTILGTVVALAALAAAPANAVVIDLFESHVKVDGTIDPAGVVTTLDSSGLGSFAVTVTGAGPHSVLGFFDYEIDEALNTFFNERGASVGAAAAGQSYEIDEPGFGGGGYFGDIFDHFTAGVLDNTVLAGEEDMSMAMGWSFILGAGQSALVTFFTDDVAPLAGFYLRQDDLLSEASVYLWSTLSFRGGEEPPTSVPEPGTLALLAIGLLPLLRRRRANA